MKQQMIRRWRRFTPIKQTFAFAFHIGSWPLLTAVAFVLAALCVKRILPEDLILSTCVYIFGPILGILLVILFWRQAVKERRLAPRTSEGTQTKAKKWFRIGLDLIKILVLSFALTASIFLFTAEEKPPYIVYLAILALFVALGQSIITSATGLDVKVAIKEVQELRADISYERYLVRAYQLYSCAERHILSCIRYWTIDPIWVDRNQRELVLSRTRDHPSGSRIPEGLKKYLEHSDLTQSIFRGRRKANTIKFLGPIGIRSEVELVTFPGVLWRILFAEAARYRSGGRTKLQIDVYSHKSPFFFIVVDDHVLIETRAVTPHYEEFKELGTYLGKNHELAEYFKSQFRQFSPEPAHRTVNKILRLAAGTPRALGTSEVEAIYDTLYVRDESMASYAVADIGVVQSAKLILIEKFGVSEGVLKDIVSGLIWDYLHYTKGCPFKPR